ncbi:MAG: hypothetical protein ACU843_09540 [Gammaproteobacteria bacterium]
MAPKIKANAMMAETIGDYPFENLRTPDPKIRVFEAVLGFVARPKSNFLIDSTRSESEPVMAGSLSEGTGQR